MNKIISVLTTITITILFLNGCAGIRHADKPALPFSEIDYGYETQILEGDPSIAYIDEGSGDKTILLVHGLASNAGFWRHNIDALAKNYRVIAVDLPGYGKSDKGDYPYGMKYYADQLVRFIDEVNLENVTYVGHSMGGQIGITLALNHPGAIDDLILAAPAGVEAFDRGEGKWLANALTHDGIVKATEPMVRQNLSINFYRWSDDFEWMVEERVRMAKTDEMNEFAYTVLESVKAMINEPTTSKLDDISVPTLIIYGQYDGMIPNRYLNPGFPQDVFEFAHQQIPNSELVEIKDAGHMLMIEQDEAFNRALLEYLVD